jgi:ABC-2 type transport system permease protein
MTTLTEEKAPPASNLALSRLPSPQALVALFVLSLRQQFRGWRPVVLSVLFLVPAALALLCVATMSHRGEDLHDQLEEWLVFKLIPGALAPLAALLSAGGIVRDETEEQTLTYLLLRPIPRTLLYAIKLLGAFIAVTTMAVFFSLLTLAFIGWVAGSSPTAWKTIPVAKVAAVFAVAQVAYCGLFGILGLLMRRSLVVGVAYIIFFEWVLASHDTLIRRATVMFHFRILVMRWIEPSYEKGWGISLAQAPTANECATYLLLVGLVLAALGAVFFALREFRMKTPEGE